MLQQGSGRAAEDVAIVKQATWVLGGTRRWVLGYQEIKVKIYGPHVLGMAVPQLPLKPQSAVQQIISSCKERLIKQILFIKRASGELCGVSRYGMLCSNFWQEVCDEVLGDCYFQECNCIAWKLCYRQESLLVAIYFTKRTWNFMAPMQCAA